MGEQQAAQSEENLATQLKKQAEQSFIGGLTGWFNGLIGGTLNFFTSLALPLVVVGGIFLAFAPPGLKDSLPEWAQKAAAYGKYGVNWLLDQLPGDLKWSYDEKDLEILEARVTPDNIRETLTSTVGLNQAQAEALIPQDQAQAQQAINEIGDFIKSANGLNLSDGFIDPGVSNAFAKPESLARFIEQHPRMMARIANTLQKSGEARGAIPTQLKDALKVILQSPSRAQSLLSQEWVQTAAVNLSGESRVDIQTFFNVADVNKEIEMLQAALDGDESRMHEIIKATVADVLADDSAHTQEDRNVVLEQVYNSMLAEEEGLGPILKAIEEKDSMFKEDFFAAGAQLAEEETRNLAILELLLKNEARIDVLKDLEQAQLASILQEIGVAGEFSMTLNGEQLNISVDALMASQASREAFVDLLKDLQRTNEQGELAALLVSENTIEDLFNYINDDAQGTSRQEALANFANKLDPDHDDSVTSGLGTRHQNAYRQMAEQIRAITGRVKEAGEQMERAETLITGLSGEYQELANILGVDVQNGRLATAQGLPQAIQNAFSDDRVRVQLMAGSTQEGANNGRMNLHLLGDLLRGSYAQELANNQTLNALLKRDVSASGAVTYPNLLAMMQAANRIDRSNGGDDLAIFQAFRETFPRMKLETARLLAFDPVEAQNLIGQHVQAIADRAEPYTNISAEQANAMAGRLNNLSALVAKNQDAENVADAENLRMMDILKAIASGEVRVEEHQEWVEPPGDFRGYEKTSYKYNADTALHGTVEFTPAEISDHVNADENRTLAALGESFNDLELPEGSTAQQLAEQFQWHDSNNNGRVDEGESLLNVARDPEFLGKLVRTMSDPERYDEIGGSDAFFRGNVAYSDLTKLAALAEIREAFEAEAPAPLDTPAVADATRSAARARDNS